MPLDLSKSRDLETLSKFHYVFAFCGLIYGLGLGGGALMWMGSVWGAMFAFAATILYAWLNWLVAQSLRDGTRFGLCVSVSLANMLLLPWLVTDAAKVVAVLLGGITLIALMRSRGTKANEESNPRPEEIAQDVTP